MPETPAVRVRFCPSPTGLPHLGLMRTALFNWAYARHHGGTVVFRIEDTDAARDSEESYHQLLDAMRWFGIDYDEGPDNGGPYGPYRQSERRDIYADVAQRLLETGHAYESYSTPEEVEARHRAAGRDPRLGYDNFDRTLTEEQKATFHAEGRQPVLRIRMPETDITFTDLVRGEVTYRAGSVPDFVIVRGSGDPLYTLTNPLDDALMHVNTVLRGEDLLSSTPRQIALHHALIDLGIAESIPRYGHLPLVVDERGKKLSKRDPRMDLFAYRRNGFLPDGLRNYVALLGWAIAPDRDIFTAEEMVAAFEIGTVNPNPARFDDRKCEAINAAHIRLLTPDDLAARLLPYLQEAGLVSDPASEREQRILREAVPLVQERMTTLAQGVTMLRFLFVADDAFRVDPDSAAKALGADAAPVLDATTAALTALGDWTAPAIETALKTALIDDLGLKPRKAFAPVRVAVTGRTVSPPLYESLELLGRDSTLARLNRATAGSPT